MDTELNFTRPRFCCNYFCEHDFNAQWPQEEIAEALELFTLIAHDFLGEEVLLKAITTDKCSHLDIKLCSDDEIRTINADQRGKDYATDVLSFPLQENIRLGQFSSHHNDLFLGDVLIAFGVCEKQAKENKIDPLSEFVHLLIHGFLHLLGFDHEISEEEEKLMQQFEENLLGRFIKAKNCSP